VYVLQQLNPTWPPREKAGCARKCAIKDALHRITPCFP